LRSSLKLSERDRCEGDWSGASRRSTFSKVVRPDIYTPRAVRVAATRDVDCLYFSETERVADLEYRRRFAGVGAATEPRLTFFAQVNLKHVVDLSRPAVRKTLGISGEDLFETWRSAPSPTRLQRLGISVSRQRRVSAIRFASDACRRTGTKGWNVAIFPGAIVAPSRVLGSPERR
jgi:hypothetical protein